MKNKRINLNSNKHIISTIVKTALKSGKLTIKHKKGNKRKIYTSTKEQKYSSKNNSPKILRTTHRTL